MKVGTVLAVVAILGMVGVAFAEDAKPVSRGFFGQVVSAADGKVVVKVGDKEVTVATDAKTVITLDGKEAKVSDLKKDLYVIVTPSEGTASKIVATTERPWKTPTTAPGAGAAPGAQTLVPINPAPKAAE